MSSCTGSHDPADRADHRRARDLPDRHDRRAHQDQQGPVDASSTRSVRSSRRPRRSTASSTRSTGTSSRAATCSRTCSSRRRATDAAGLVESLFPGEGAKFNQRVGKNDPVRQHGHRLHARHADPGVAWTWSADRRRARQGPGGPRPEVRHDGRGHAVPAARWRLARASEVAGRRHELAASVRGRAARRACVRATATAREAPAPPEVPTGSRSAVLATAAVPVVGSAARSGAAAAGRSRRRPRTPERKGQAALGTLIVERESPAPAGLSLRCRCR